MKKQDHDALIIFVLAFAICGLQGIKSCQEKKEEENGKQSTPRTSILSPLSAQETKKIQFNSATSPYFRGGSFTDGNSGAERMQK
jgi:hypothetical protein